MFRVRYDSGHPIETCKEVPEAHRVSKARRKPTFNLRTFPSQKLSSPPLWQQSGVAQFQPIHMSVGSPASKEGGYHTNAPTYCRRTESPSCIMLVVSMDVYPRSSGDLKHLLKPGVPAGCPAMHLPRSSTRNTKPHDRGLAPPHTDSYLRRSRPGPFHVQESREWVVVRLMRAASVQRTCSSPYS